MTRRLISALVVAMCVGLPTAGRAQLYDAHHGGLFGSSSPDVAECADGLELDEINAIFTGGYGGPYNSNLDETCETRADFQSFPALTGACIFQDVVGEDFSGKEIAIGDVCFNFYEEDGDDSATACTDRGGTFVEAVDCSEAELPAGEEEPEAVPTLPLAGQGLLGLLLLGGALAVRRFA